MRIGIYGGTFDPPHNGHLALAQAAKESLQLDEVVFMPANRNPDKAHRMGTPAQDRLEMVRLLVEGEQGLAYSDSEITRGGISYSVDTMSELQYAQPAEYWWIMGADALKGLPQWKQPERLIKLCRLAVAIRPPMSPTDVMARLPQEFKDRTDVVQMKPMDVSSSDIRDRIARGQSVTPWVPAKIVRYIEQHKLYRG